MNSASRRARKSAGRRKSADRRKSANRRKSFRRSKSPRRRQHKSLVGKYGKPATQLALAGLTARSLYKSPVVRKYASKVQGYIPASLQRLPQATRDRITQLVDDGLNKIRKLLEKGKVWQASLMRRQVQQDLTNIHPEADAALEAGEQEMGLYEQLRRGPQTVM